ncbi:HD domain-containing protein [Patescibacteria group bacterium]|nr:HD domain-containing protein [Patescibacteria group bacterium]MBU1906971.1 HD domain-containing protein [Patescibacteria group bacterium]
MTQDQINFDDPIYGEFSTTSPVLVELINCPSVQRLKGVSQFGLPDEYYHLEGFSRFQHSVGVMRLLQILGASEEEQIAGLLHDVSHTAFSHIIDWVVGRNVEEDWQDNQLASYIAKSEIPEILNKYEYDADRISNHQLFPLLEQEVPVLCADRIDYTFQEIDPLVARMCLQALSTHQDRIVFSNEDPARVFSKEFLKLQNQHWGGFEAVSRYTLFADVLKYALDQEIIRFDDLWQTDEFVISKLKAVLDKRIQYFLNLLRSKSLSDLPKNNLPTDKKFRFVDPEIVDNGMFCRLSECSSDYSNSLDQARRENQTGVFPVDLEACIKAVGI